MSAPQLGHPDGPRVLLVVTHPPVADVFLDVIIELLAAGASVALLAVEDSRKDEWRNVRMLGGDRVEVLASPERSPLAGAWAGLRGLLDVGRYYEDVYDSVPIHRRRYPEMLRRQASDHGASERTLVEILLWLLDRRLARPPTLAGLRAAERLLPEPKEIRDILSRTTPSLLAVSPLVDFASPLAPYVRAAERGRIPTVALVPSWDQLTSKGGLRPPPDRVLVWNEAQRRELAGLHGIGHTRSRATGAPRYDRWMRHRPTRDRAALLRELGLPSTEVVLCYAASSPFIGAHEPTFVRRWLRAIRAAADERLRAASVIVRPHPQALDAWRETDYDDLRPVAVYPRDDRIPSRDDAAAQILFDTLSCADALVGLSTTAFLDAGTLGKPSFTVLDEDFSETQRLLHLNLVAADDACLHTAATLEEHVEQLERFLADPEPLRAAAHAFALGFIGYDVSSPSSVRTANAMLELVGSQPDAAGPSRPSVPSGASVGPG